MRQCHASPHACAAIPHSRRQVIDMPLPEHGPSPSLAQRKMLDRNSRGNNAVAAAPCPPAPVAPDQRVQCPKQLGPRRSVEEAAPMRLTCLAVDYQGRPTGSPKHCRCEARPLSPPRVCEASTEPTTPTWSQAHAPQPPSLGRRTYTPAQPSAHMHTSNDGWMCKDQKSLRNLSRDRGRRALALLAHASAASALCACYRHSKYDGVLWRDGPCLSRRPRPTSSAGGCTVDLTWAPAQPPFKGCRRSTVKGKPHEPPRGVYVLASVA